jgi:phosphoglycerate dehydrogenase-like enzyme
VPDAAVLVTWPGFEPNGAQTGARLRAAGYTVRLAPDGAGRSPSRLIALLDGAAGAIVSTERFDARVLAAARRLRVIARVGVGTDSIDLEAAARHGVAVCTTPGANTATTADHTLALMLAALRRVPQHDRGVRAGGWARTGPALAGELEGATVGLVGYGAIGRAVRRRLAGFGARVLVCDPWLGDAPDVERADLDALLRASDIVSLHLPLSADTHGLLDRRRLALLSPHAVLVNTARGGLVDEDALADALERGALRAAALDVLALEPPPRNARLLGLANVVLTPHVAGLSERSVAEMTRRATDAVLAALAGEEPPGLVRRPERAGAAS